MEYGYAKQRGFPVASVLNKAGLLHAADTRATSRSRCKGATLNADLTQNLGGVYKNPDPRAYPVSSYSYLIVPTTTAKPFTAAKGTTLSKFILYMVCAGQQKAAQLGYSPLPKNLVQDAFNVVQKIPGHVNPPPINQCDNPTITQAVSDSNTTPPPPASDKQGAAPPPSETPTTVGSNGGAIYGVQVPVTTPNTVATGGKKRVVIKTPGGAPGGGGGDPVAAPAGQQAQTFRVASGPVEAPSSRDPLPLLLYVVAAVVALLAIFGPPTLSFYSRRSQT